MKLSRDFFCRLVKRSKFGAFFSVGFDKKAFTHVYSPSAANFCSSISKNQDKNKYAATKNLLQIVHCCKICYEPISFSGIQKPRVVVNCTPAICNKVFCNS